jgi:putative transposase
VARLMKLANCRPGASAAGFQQQRDEENYIAPNHLQREFEALEPNQKWVADFTYIWTAEGWLYAAAVMDLYSRRIVG